MPGENELVYFFISAPADDSKQLTLQKVQSKIASQPSNSYSDVLSFHIPDLKVGTLDSLVTATDDLLKADQLAEAAIGKIVENIRTLFVSNDNKVINNTGDPLKNALMVNDRTMDAYIRSFQWNSVKYRTDKTVKDLMDMLVQEINSIDQMVRSKMTAYQTVKNSLVANERKQTGNLSVRSLATVVKKEHFVPTDSEFIETVLVAVPNSLIKDFMSKYESLAPMVVPRSANKIAEDQEFTLYAVVVFKRTSADFTQKLRDERFVPREFVFDESRIASERKELADLSTSSKDQWSNLVRICRTNFGELFQAWIHLKALRVFVESILRYGLPPNFQAMSVKPKPQMEKKIRQILGQHFVRLGSSIAKGKNNEPLEDIQGVTYDKEYLPYVSFDLRMTY